MRCSLSLVVLAATSMVAPIRADGWYKKHSCITSISDLDGDGVRDLIVANRDVRQRECVWAISGKTGKLLFRLEGAKQGDGFGGALAEIGDVNKDGVPDFAVGAIGGNLRRDPERFGAYSVDFVAPAYVRVLSGKDGHVLLEKIADISHDEMGYAVAAAGDVDGDGVPDLLVSRNERVATSGPEVKSTGTCVALSGKDGSELRTLHPPREVGASEQFGGALALVDDIDGDHKPDWAVGAPGRVSPEQSELGGGHVFIFSSRDGSLLKTLSAERDESFFGATITSSRATCPTDNGFLAVAATGHFARVWSLRDWSSHVTVPGHGVYVTTDDFGTSLDFARDPRSHVFYGLVVGADETVVEFRNEGYAEVHPLDLHPLEGSKPLVLAKNEKQGIDVCALDDVNGDLFGDFALVFVKDMKLRIASGKDGSVIRETNLLELGKKAETK